MYKYKNKPLSCLGARQSFVKRPKKKSIQLSIIFEDNGPGPSFFCIRFCLLSPPNSRC